MGRGRRQYGMETEKGRGMKVKERRVGESRGDEKGQEERKRVREGKE